MLFKYLEHAKVAILRNRVWEVKVEVLTCLGLVSLEFDMSMWYGLHMNDVMRD